MKNFDLIDHGDPVLIITTGVVGTVEATQNSPYFKHYRVAGDWYKPSELRRADDAFPPRPEWSRK